MYRIGRIGSDWSAFFMDNGKTTVAISRLGMNLPPVHTSLSLTQSVNLAANLLATDAAAAKREAESILQRTPGDPRVLLILASALRRLGDAKAAIDLLLPLAKAYPGAARTQYELGLVLGERNDAAGAINALRTAVSLNPELPEAWLALGDRLFAAGDLTAAEAAFAEHAKTSIQDPALRPIADALFANRAVEAEERIWAHLKSKPDDPAALHLLAESFQLQDRLEEAESVFAHCLGREPENDGARFSYATALFRRQAAAQALEQIEYLRRKAPESVAYRNLHAACLALGGRHDEALALYEGLLAQFPQHPRLWLNYGQALRTIRRRDDAVAAYQRAIGLSPQFGEAYWSLANLKTVPLSDGEKAAVLAQLARDDIETDDRLHLHFALGKALEDRRDHHGAFTHYAAGAKVRHQGLAYDAQAATALMERSCALFTRSFFATRAEGGSEDDAPIFVVGLPRSGSTLVEQILASHSQVEGTMELPDIGYIAQSLRGKTTQGPARRYPEAAADLDPRSRADLGNLYITRTQIHRAKKRAFFIDKMPNNFSHVGLIHLILPKAKIIDVRRHPMGACFSAFKQHFAQGQAFSYDLADLGLYYRDYVGLMRHYSMALPGRVHRVIYEDLIENTEGEVRRLLDHCGLPFEADCLSFYDNDRAVRTVSSEQVRRPIFREGLEHWRNYEPWLDPLKLALGPVMETWRD